MIRLICGTDKSGYLNVKDENGFFQKTKALVINGHLQVIGDCKYVKVEGGKIVELRKELEEKKPEPKKKAKAKTKKKDD